MKHPLLVLGILLTLTSLFASCDAWQDDIRLRDEAQGKNLFEVIKSNQDLSVFAQILQATGYDAVLQGNQALTVFAPKNDVLSGVLSSDTVRMKEWIKNYIAYYAFYTDATGAFKPGDIRMINGKNVPVKSDSVSTAAIEQANLASANGVLHILDGLIAERKSILEYLSDQTSFQQVQYILSENQSVMDMDRSVQTGVDGNGNPVYEIVWKTSNLFLEAFPLGDETQSYTVLLLSDNAVNKLKTKYAKYMNQEDDELEAREILKQITCDMVLAPCDINATGRYLSMHGDSMLVDVDLTAVKNVYQASNGKVYQLDDVDVKMYKNKIKEKTIEAEDYTSRWDGQDGWEVRYRAWASGGKDVVLKGQTRTVFEYYIWNTEGDSVQTLSETKTFNMIHRSNEGFVSKSTNAYLEFKTEMFSVPYEFFWRTYDDKSAHIYSVTGQLYSKSGTSFLPLFTTDGTTIVPYTLQLPMKVEQKMLVSFPGKPALMRSNDGTFLNNFTAYSVMATESVAGVSSELQLVRYKTTTTDNLFMLGSSLTAPLTPYATEDDFGKGKVLKCPTYGTGTFFISNTIREKDTNAGAMFLDYIRLVPQVDPND